MTNMKIRTFVAVLLASVTSALLLIGSTMMVAWLHPPSIQTILGGDWHSNDGGMAWPIDPPAEWDQLRGMFEQSDFFRSVQIYYALRRPTSDSTQDSSAIARVGLDCMVQVRYGWPLRCNSCVVSCYVSSLGAVLDEEGRSATRNIVWCRVDGGVLSRLWAIPCGVSWSRAFGNGLLLVAIVMSCRSTMTALVRRRKRRRQVCMRCSYPVTGLSRCPECGLGYV